MSSVIYHTFYFIHENSEGLTVSGYLRKLASLITKVGKEWSREGWEVGECSEDYYCKLQRNPYFYLPV